MKDFPADPPPSDPAESKRELRARIRAERARLPQATREQWDSQILEHVLKHLATRQARVVAAYWPLPGEPGGPELIPRLHEAGIQFLLPRVVPGTRNLEFCLYDGHVSTGTYGITEPMGPADPRFPEEVEQFLIPALAVDEQGFRLGQGGGFYDRNIGELSTDTEVCAILDHREYLTRVPTEPWDLRVPAVITQNGYSTILK